MKSWFTRSLLSILLLAGMYLPAAASTPADPVCVWTGSMSDDYSAAGNWTCDTVPGLTSIVVIAPASRPPRAGGPASAGTLTINSGAMLTLNTDARLTIASGFTLNQAAELFPGANSEITLLNGDWANNGGAIVGSGPWDAVFDGQGDQAITGYRPEQTFSNLTLNNTSMILPEVSFGASTTAVNVNGTLTLNKDTALNPGPAGKLILNGDLTNNGGGFQGSGMVSFEGGNDQLIGGSTPTPIFPGSVTVNKTTGTLSLASNLAGVSFNGVLNIQGGTLRLGGKNLYTGTTTVGPGTLDLGGGTWTANGTITLNSGGTFLPDGGRVDLENGDWTGNYGFVDARKPWKLAFNGPGDQAINGTASIHYLSGVTLSNPTMGLFKVQTGGNTSTVKISGDLTLGPDTAFGASEIWIGGNLNNNGGTLLGGLNNEVTLFGPNPQTIGGTALQQIFPGGLMIDKPVQSVTLGGSTTRLNVNGELTITGGTLKLGSGTLTTGDRAAVYKTGALELETGIWDSNACIYMQTGGVLRLGSGALNFRGGTFGFYGGQVEPGSGAANFFLHGDQNIGGMGTATFHNLGVFNATMGPAVLVFDGPEALVLSGALQIGDSATFDAGTLLNIYLGSAWQNDGDFVPRASTVTFNGSAPLRSLDAAQIIGGARPTTFNNLTVDNSAGVTLGASQTVSGALNLRAGGLTAAGYTLTLGSAATISGTHSVVGAVQRTQTFVAGMPYSFGGANETITFAEVGTVTSVTVNSQNVAADGLRPAIPRTVAITPLGAGYNATLRLPYQDAELNGIPEENLRLWRRGATRWDTQGPQAVNSAENWVEQSGITAFSTWALAPVNASQGSRIHLPLVMR